MAIQSFATTRGTWYFNGDGYYYRKSKIHNAVMFLICTNSNCITTAQVNVDLTGDIRRGRRDHNHNGNVNLIEEMKLRKKILLRSERKQGSQRRLYDDLISEVPLQISKWLSYAKTRNSMKSRKHRAGDRIPENFHGLKEKIENNQDYCTTHQGINYFVDGNDENLVFISPTNSELFNMPNIIYSMDGTFKVCPKKPAIYQLFTLGGLYNNTFFPIVYALMTRKNAENYLYLFNLLRNRYPNWNPNHIISDYETGSVPAFLDVFQQNGHVVRAQGCWFHFSQAIEKRAKQKLKMHAELENDNLIQSLVKKTMALPLLSADQIANGYNYIRDTATQFYGPETKIIGLLNYVRNHWLQKIGAARISVAGSPHRTNNHIEAFHRNIMLHMTDMRSGSNPHVEVFLTGLRKLENVHASNFLSALENLRTAHRRKPKWVDQDNRIAEATRRLNDENEPFFGINSFLDWMAHANNFHFEEIQEDEPVAGEDVEVEFVVVGHEILE